MIQVTFEVDEGLLARFHKDPDGFAAEMRIAAAVKWYELGLVSHGRAAEVAGLPRAACIDALSRYGVSPFQQDADEIVADAEAAASG